MDKGTCDYRLAGYIPHYPIKLNKINTRQKWRGGHIMDNKNTNKNGLYNIVRKLFESSVIQWSDGPDSDYHVGIKLTLNVLVEAGLLDAETVDAIAPFQELRTLTSNPVAQILQHADGPVSGASN